MSLTCQQLLDKYPQKWKTAISHPFIDSCAAGTIKPEQFNTWLVQDYLFVIEFTRFLAQGLASAPVEHFEVLLGGLQAIKDELQWFQTKASERQLSLDVPKQTTCQAYGDYMAHLATAPYPVQALALWAIEIAYNQAWQLPGKMAAPYLEFAQRWGNAQFSEYVQLLGKQADAALETASPEVQQQAEDAFLKIADLERDFWQMAYQSE